MALAAMNPLLWLAWFLEFCGFAIMLGGVAGLQRTCGADNLDGYGQSVAGVPNVPLNSLAVGVSGYLGPVRCDKMFSYTWWITFYEFFLVVLIPLLLSMGALHKFRAGLIGLIAPATVLMMDTANTYLQVKDFAPGASGARARVVVAGSIISSVANFLKIIVLGIHDEKANYRNSIGAAKEPAPTAATTMGGVYIPPGTVPVSTTTGTTTYVAPATVPGGAPIEMTGRTAAVV